MHTDAITLPVAVLAVLTVVDLCDHKSFKFPAYLGSQLSILAVISSRSSCETAAISIAGGIAAQSPDHNGCAWGERSIRFKIHPKPAVVSSHRSMLLGLVKK
jgi:hypothetical protein